MNCDCWAQTKIRYVQIKYKKYNLSDIADYPLQIFNTSLQPYPFCRHHTLYSVSPDLSDITHLTQYHQNDQISHTLLSITRPIRYHTLYSISPDLSDIAHLTQYHQNDQISHDYSQNIPRIIRYRTPYSISPELSDIT